MRRALGFAILAVVFILAGCSEQEEAAADGKLNAVASFFPLYDFTKTIGGDRVNVINMIPAGIEPHDWTPRSKDMAQLAKSQLFVYQGAGFEGWTEDVLGGIDTSGLVIVEASKGIDLIKDGGEPDSHGHGANEQHSDEDHHHGMYDPHTWLSPKSALTMAENVKNGLIQADPEHTASYEQNYAVLVEQLHQLDRAYSEQLANVPNREIVVSHQAFGYLARDYDLTQMPMMGISAEAEPTAQDLKKISEFITEHQVKYIFVEQLSSDALAKTLANDLGIGTLSLHPLEGLTEAEMGAGETYISIMEKNLEQLVTALK